MVLAAVPAFSSEQDAEFQSLLEGLASEVFQERVAAEESLRAWAMRQRDGGKNLLAGKMERSEDPEVTSRLRQVLMEAVVRDEMAAGPGYVGIAPADLSIPGGKGGERGAVSVLFVAPGTPGERAGLKPGDVIISLDGGQWEVGKAADAFRAGIAAKRPGTKVRFEVLRIEDAQPGEIEVELAPRPLVLPNPAAGMFGAPREPLDPRVAEERARENLFRVWMDKWRLENR